MSKLILVHGYGMALQIPGLRSHRGITAGFQIFKPDILDGTAKVFNWSIDATIPRNQAIKPNTYRQHYLAERKKATSQEVHQDLIELIEQEAATTILCHSLGCQLLINTINIFGLPTSVRQIIFSQADIDQNEKITNPDVCARLKNKTLQLTNYYCPWDITLIASAIHHRHSRAGLTGLNDPLTINKFNALTKLPNLHMSALRSEKFRQQVLKII